MKSHEDIRNAFESVKPDGKSREKMLNEILAKKSQKNHGGVVKLSLLPMAAAGMAVVIGLGALGFFFFSGKGGDLVNPLAESTSDAVETKRAYITPLEGELELITTFLPRLWFHYSNDDQTEWDSTIDLTIEEFPDVDFSWTEGKITATESGVQKELFALTLPIVNAYLADLNGDGFPEICVMEETDKSAISPTQKCVYVSSTIFAYDYRNDCRLELLQVEPQSLLSISSISVDNERLIVTSSDDVTGEVIGIGTLASIDGEQLVVFWDDDVSADKGVDSSKYQNLYEQNPDLVGSITLTQDPEPANGIDTDAIPFEYPVVQTQDNEFYLYHDFGKGYSQDGTIFADYRNRFGPEGALSDNTILYGHNLITGKNFGSLMEYRKTAADGSLSYYKEKPTINFDTLYDDTEWKIFAVALFNTQEEYGEVYDYCRTDFNGKDDFDQYVADVNYRSFISTDVDVEYGDKLLTLSTYDFSMLSDMRLAVFARKVRPGESADVDVSKAAYDPTWLDDFSDYAYEMRKKNRDTEN